MSASFEVLNFNQDEEWMFICTLYALCMLFEHEINNCIRISHNKAEFYLILSLLSMPLRYCQGKVPETADGCIEIVACGISGRRRKEVGRSDVVTTVVEALATGF